MGRSKDSISNDQYREPEGNVCENCIDDKFLKNIIRNNVVSEKCDICNCSIQSAPIAKIMRPISEAIKRYYVESTDEYSKYNETIELLEDDFGLQGNERLLAIIGDSFENVGRVEAFDGYWNLEQPSVVMRRSWERFVQTVKHESRYFFHNSVSTFEFQDITPINLLDKIGDFVNKYDELLSQLHIDTDLYRARKKVSSDNWLLISDELGAPPQHKSSAGRMNPAGISYLYLAFDIKTALTEIRIKISEEAAVGTFVLNEELTILDLTQLPERPSVFDHNEYEKYEIILFLEAFVAEIIKPVNQDGKEHIEYLPSQIVSEYFALVFKTKDGSSLNGIKYPSSIKNGRHNKGCNLVLFPTQRTPKLIFDNVSLVDVLCVKWIDLDLI